MNKTLLFVVNPIAGGTDKKSLITKIKTWAEKTELTVEFWETSGKNDKQHLREKAELLNPEAIIAVGGDGTLLLCAEAVRNTETKLGIIPGGSANGMATELEIPGNINEALAIIQKGHVIAADMILFNGEKLGLHISDIGANARLVKNFEKSERRGFLGYASGVISELINLEYFDVEIETEKENIRERCYMVAFANARRYGTGALLNKKGKINDGLFEICILKEFDLASIAGQFWDVIDDDSEHMSVVQCRKAVIRTKQDVCFQIDGELQEGRKVIEAEIVPSCLKLIVPE